MPIAPDPTTIHPLPAHPRVVFLRPLVRSAQIEVGDYTYYDDPEDPEAFEIRNVLYAYGPERLVIGRYCALAAGVRFLMAGANHAMSGVSTFPFTIFGGDWAQRTLDLLQAIPSRGDTVVGHDVWLGYEAVVMPGVHIGHGAIVAAVGGRLRRAAVRNRRRQPGPARASPVRGRRRGAAPARGVVGLAARARDRARAHDHGGHSGGRGADRRRARADQRARSPMNASVGSTATA